jgi:hypothetical protein
MIILKVLKKREAIVVQKKLFDYPSGTESKKKNDAQLVAPKMQPNPDN